MPCGLHRVSNKACPEDCIFRKCFLNEAEYRNVVQVFVPSYVTNKLPRLGDMEQCRDTVLFLLNSAETVRNLFMVLRNPKYCYVERRPEPMQPPASRRCGLHQSDYQLCSQNCPYLGVFKTKTEYEAVAGLMRKLYFTTELQKLRLQTYRREAVLMLLHIASEVRSRLG